MNQSQSNWVNNPTPNQVFWATVLWAISVSVLTLCMTDLFHTSPFQTRYMSCFLLILGATFTVLRVHQNYRKK